MLTRFLRLSSETNFKPSLCFLQFIIRHYTTIVICYISPLSKTLKFLVGTGTVLCVLYKVILCNAWPWLPRCYVCTGYQSKNALHSFWSELQELNISPLFPLWTSQQITLMVAERPWTCWRGGSRLVICAVLPLWLWQATSDREKPEQGAAFCFSSTQLQEFIILQAAPRELRGQQWGKALMSSTAPHDLKEAPGCRLQSTAENGRTNGEHDILTSHGLPVECSSVDLSNRGRMNLWLSVK